VDNRGDPHKRLREQQEDWAPEIKVGACEWNRKGGLRIDKGRNRAWRSLK